MKRDLRRSPYKQLWQVCGIDCIRQVYLPHFPLVKKIKPTGLIAPYKNRILGMGVFVGYPLLPEDKRGREDGVIAKREVHPLQ